MEEQFNEVVNKLNELKKNKNNKIPDNILMQFYALYKQVTIGDVNIEQPAMYEVIARMKYNAWLDKQGLNKTTAMKLYINLAKDNNLI